jgi:putative transcriptional regulator
MIMLKSYIGRLIDESPYKNEFVMKYMGISRNTLSNWRTGKAFPTIEKAFKLSRLLGVTIEDLFEYIEEECENEGARNH